MLPLYVGTVLLRSVLYSHHRQVVALFSLAYELMHSLCHLFYYGDRRRLAVNTSCFRCVVQTLLAKLLMLKVLSLRQSVGI